MSRTTVMIDEETARWADRLAEAINTTRPAGTQPATRSSVLRAAQVIGLDHLSLSAGYTHDEHVVTPDAVVGGGR
jgi:hypothetical protein